MSLRGIAITSDTAASQVAIRQEGFAFVVSHLGAGSAAHLTAERARDYIAAGLSIVSVYDTPQQAMDATPVGYDPRLFENPTSVLRDVAYQGGVADGRRASALAKAVGQPAGSAIFFDVDADVREGISYVLDYFRGIAEGISRSSAGQVDYKVGVGGSGYVLDAVFDAGLAEFKWLAAPVEWQGSAGYEAYDIAEQGALDDPTLPGVVAHFGVASDAGLGGGFGEWGISASAPNLVINDLAVRTTPMTAGGDATIIVAIGNAGTATTPASKAKLYLSADATIDSSDTVLATFDVPSLAAGAAATNSVAWTVSADMAPGTYHIGIAADVVPGETSDTDNAYAISVTVADEAAAGPNLVINQLSLGAEAVAAGGVQTIGFEVGNAGAGASSASTATLYMSADATITAADIFLGAFPVPSLAPNAATAGSLSVAIPAGTAEGTYHIGVVASPTPGEANTNDNTYAAGFAVTAAPLAKPNLVINDLSLGASPISAGSAQTIDFAVGNAGTATSDPSSATVYLSSDANITPADTVLGTLAIPALAAGAAAGGRLLSAIPSSLAGGTYYIGVVADLVPGEPNVHDNAYAESFVVTRTPGAISISDVAVTEGNDGTTVATFMVTRTGGTTAFDVGFATADGGATVADGDYLPVSGTLTFDEFVVMRTVTVAVIGDTVDEAPSPQTFFVNLSGATNGAVIVDDQGQGTIVDDDRRNHLPLVVVRDVRVHAGQAVSGASLVLSVADEDGDLITHYAFRDGADGGGSLQVAGAAVAAGTWTPVPLAELGNVAYVGGATEGTEQIGVRAFDGMDWSEVRELTATTIAALADDYGHTPQGAGGVSVGGFVTGSIEAPGDADWFAVPLIAGERYHFDLEGNVTAAGTLADPVLELRDSSGGSLEIAADDNNGTGSNARLTFTATRSDSFFLSAHSADDTTGSYKLSVAAVPSARLAIAALDAAKPEGRSGTTLFTFNVARSGDLSLPAVASYVVSGSGPHPASAMDFTGNVFPSGSIAFLPGETSKTISIGVAGDVIVEDDETFTVTINPMSADVVVQTATSGGVIKDDDAIIDIVVINTATGQRVAVDPAFYEGPVAGLDKEIIHITPDNLNVTVGGDNWFIRTGSGTDALAAYGGRNVLDGGTGSNFLSGAWGEDTFFLDARGATEDIWSTVVGFGGGDSVTVWGASSRDGTISWIDDLGAAGFKGLTMQATGPGKPNALVTLAGYSKADMDSGRLQVTFGSSEAAGSYLHIHGLA